MAEKKPTKKPVKKTEGKPKQEKPADAPKEEIKVEKTTEKKSETTEKKPKTAEKKPETTVKRERKSKKGLIFGLIFGALAIVAIVLLVVFLPKGGDPSDPKAKISYSDSFFISNNGKYMLWNKDGERLTEEEYSYASDFVDGYAYVRKDDQAGIIRDNGSMSVEFGRYGTISAKGGLYLAQDGNTKEYFLITGDGHALLHGDSMDARASSSSGAYALVKQDGKYYVFTCKGTKILEEDVNDEEESPNISSSEDFGLVYYNGKTTLFDIRSGNILATADERYSFDEISDNRAKIILQNYDDSKRHLLIVDGKQYELDETKYYGFTALNQVIGYDNYEELALLDDNYKVSKRTTTDIALKDSKNYAVLNEDDTVQIIYNGEPVKTFSDEPDLATGIMYEDYYAILNDGKWMFYRLDGSVAYEHEFHDVRSLFNKHHQAVVADEDGEYYLINADFTRVGDQTWRRFYAYESGYEVYDKDGNYAILDKKGELATEVKYEDTYYRSAPVGHNIWTARNSYGNHDVYDIDAHTLILEHANVQSFFANYFTVKNTDGKVEYFTYAGKSFYVAEK